MLLNPKTLEQLRIIINGDGTDDYRSGSALVTFFNELGFSEDYWKKSREESFPSRWIYTDEKLKKINGTPELDKAIKNVFAVQNFIGRIIYYRYKCIRIRLYDGNYNKRKIKRN